MQLRSFYTAPSSILLTFDDVGTPLAVVAFLVTDRVAEIRRLYVVPGQRTSGHGRRLTETLLAQARQLDLDRVVLSTLPTMVHAQNLYRSLGFVGAEPYVDKPTDGVLYFALDLRQQPDPTSMLPTRSAARNVPHLLRPTP